MGLRGGRTTWSFRTDFGKINFIEIKYAKEGCLVEPLPIESLTGIKIKKLSCGEAHSMVLTEEGKVYGWGFTSNGQLGLGKYFLNK